MKFLLKNIILIILVFGVSLMYRVKAQELTRGLLKIDETLHDDTQNNSFREPKSILIIPLEPPVSNFNINSSEWYQGVYYFMSGRLNLGDILFHYVISQDGLVFSGIIHGDEQSIEIKNGPDSPIVVAYLSSAGSNDFDKNSYTDLSNLILKLANKHSIPLDKVYVKKVDFIKTDNSFEIKSKRAGGRYELTLSEIRKDISSLYKPLNKNYSIKISNIKLPQKMVNYLDKVVVKFDVQNTSKFTIFSGSDSEFILAKKDGNQSMFYTESNWLTRSDSSLMSSGMFLRPNTKKTVKMQLTIPLYFGLQSETYVLKDLNGKIYEGTEFNIAVNIKKLNEPIIEILKTETGTLNVRDVPGGRNIISALLPGGRYIRLDYQSGWVKIKLVDGSVGWVLGRYIKGV